MAEKKKIDIWRESYVRYLGYANELGESFRPMYPRLVIPSYAISLLYVAGDTQDKAFKAKSNRLPVAIDTLVWQSLASVAIPGFTINRVVALTSAAMKSTVKQSSPRAVKWVPTLVGLGIIPLIIHPIDSFVDYAMDNTTRTHKWFK